MKIKSGSIDISKEAQRLYEDLLVAKKPSELLEKTPFTILLETTTKFINERSIMDKDSESTQKEIKKLKDRIHDLGLQQAEIIKEIKEAHNIIEIIEDDANPQKQKETLTTINKLNLKLDVLEKDIRKIQNLIEEQLDRHQKERDYLKHLANSLLLLKEKLTETWAKSDRRQREDITKFISSCLYQLKNADILRHLPPEIFATINFAPFTASESKKNHPLIIERITELFNIPEYKESLIRNKTLWAFLRDEYHTRRFLLDNDQVYTLLCNNPDFLKQITEGNSDFFDSVLEGSHRFWEKFCFDYEKSKPIYKPILPYIDYKNLAKLMSEYEDCLSYVCQNYNQFTQPQYKAGVKIYVLQSYASGQLYQRVDHQHATLANYLLYEIAPPYYLRSPSHPVKKILAIENLSPQLIESLFYLLGEKSAEGRAKVLPPVWQEIIPNLPQILKLLLDEKNKCNLVPLQYKAVFETLSTSNMHSLFTASLIKQCNEIIKQAIAAANPANKKAIQEFQRTFIAAFPAAKSEEFEEAEKEEAEDEEEEDLLPPPYEEEEKEALLPPPYHEIEKDPTPKYGITPAPLTEAEMAQLETDSIAEEEEKQAEKPVIRGWRNPSALRKEQQEVKEASSEEIAEPKESISTEISPQSEQESDLSKQEEKEEDYEESIEEESEYSSEEEEEEEEEEKPKRKRTPMPSN